MYESQRPTGMVNNLVIMTVVGVFFGFVVGILDWWALEIGMWVALGGGAIVGGLAGAIAGLVPFLRSSPANIAAAGNMMGGLLGLLFAVALLSGLFIGVVTRLL